MMEQNPLKDALETLPAILQYGTLGVGALLLVLTGFMIMRRVKGKDAKDQQGLILILSFMVFGIVVLLIGAASSFLQPPEKLETEKNADPVTTQLVKDSNVSLQRPGKSDQIKFHSYEDQELWDYVEEYKDSINELYICGAHLQNGVGMILAPIKSILQAGNRVTLVFTNYDDVNTIRYQAARDRTPSEDDLRRRIEKTLAEIEQLRSQVPDGKLEVRVISWPIDERMHIINPKQRNSRIYLKLYPYKNEYSAGVYRGGLSFYVEKAEGDREYSYYLEKFGRYLDDAHPYRVTGNLSAGQ